MIDSPSGGESLRERLERAAEESRSPVYPVFGWKDLKNKLSDALRRVKEILTHE